MTTPRKTTPNGLGVDSSGNSVYDPSANVLSLVELAVTRLDDLRAAEAIRSETRFADEKIHIREIMALEAEHQKELTIAEAKRIDAIRAVDVNAVNVANEKAVASAQVLATQVVQSAETLRSLVATSAQATAIQLQQIITPITDRLSLLEKSQYESFGKAGVTDPLMGTLLVEMKSLRDSVVSGTGKSAGLNAAWVYLIGAISLIGAIIAIMGLLAK
jgi:hypothetical protein